MARKPPPDRAKPILGKVESPYSLLEAGQDRSRLLPNFRQGGPHRTSLAGRRVPIQRPRRSRRLATPSRQLLCSGRFPPSYCDAENRMPADESVLLSATGAPRLSVARLPWCLSSGLDDVRTLGLRRGMISKCVDAVEAHATRLDARGRARESGRDTGRERLFLRFLSEIWLRWVVLRRGIYSWNEVVVSSTEPMGKGER